MKRLPLMTAIGLSLSLSPLALSGAAADTVPVSPPVHKVPAFLHHEGEPVHANHRFAAQATAGAFLEMTDVAP